MKLRMLGLLFCPVPKVGRLHEDIVLPSQGQACTGVNGQLFSPGNYPDPSRLEFRASEHGAPSKFAGSMFGRNKQGMQPAGLGDPT